MDGPPSPLRALAADDSGEQPAPLRYCIGEKLYYTGVSADYNGDRLTYGACCEVREWSVAVLPGAKPNDGAPPPTPPVSTPPGKI